MKSNLKWVVLFVAAILVLIIAFQSITTRTIPFVTKDGHISLFWTSNLTSTNPKQPAPAIPVPVQMSDICDQIKASKDPATTRALLAKLRNLLNSLPQDVASREVQNFLTTGKDADTKLDLTIQSGGLIDDTSSVRVFLLNYLGLVDPAAGGELATQILDHYTTPDEWAVSLRNYAKVHFDKAGIAYLQQKDRELLSNAAWVKDPSAGFLEAFDTIVYAKDIAVTPALSNLLRDKSNIAAGHAAYLTMDRLVIAEPKTMLKTLVDDPSLMKGHEKTRADFVARADIGLPEDRAIVEKYLLAPNLSAEELSQFVAIYPNFNYMISNNLLTDTTPLPRDIIVKRDQAALAVVQQWQDDPRFDHLQPALDQLQKRLQGFVQEAQASH